MSSEIPQKDLCPCCSQKPYSQCCQAYLEQIRPAPTAQALMRSRYTAYSLANISYIKQTMCGPALLDFDELSAKQWAKSVQWQKLEIIKYGTKQVEFKAHYIDQGRQQLLHEISQFKQMDGQWFYYDGKPAKPPSLNGACPCGSGKKYKRCCYVTA